jgi:hypothetical protein
VYGFLDCKLLIVTVMIEKITAPRRCLLAAFALAASLAANGSAAAGAAEALPDPAGAVILTVAGAIERTNAGAAADLDRAMLEGLGTETVRTSTPYTTGVQEFRGVPLKRLLDALGARGRLATMIALNDYRVAVPLGDAETPGVILAFERNGEPMPVRDKGPLWLIYPLDGRPELDTRETHAKLIWQLRRIEIR